MEKIKLLLKRLIGIVSHITHPGFSSCFRCWRVWKIAKPHSTMYTDSFGCFPLCEECWQVLTPEQRLPYYRALYDKWRNAMTPGMRSFQEIKEAVMKGD